jgi:hypothetical protein
LQPGPGKIIADLRRPTLVVESKIKKRRISCTLSINYPDVDPDGKFARLYNLSWISAVKVPDMVPVLLRDDVVKYNRAVTAKNRRAVVVEGYPGSGKTTMAWLDFLQSAEEHPTEKCVWLSLPNAIAVVAHNGFAHFCAFSSPSHVGHIFPHIDLRQGIFSSFAGYFRDIWSPPCDCFRVVVDGIKSKHMNDNIWTHFFKDLIYNDFVALRDVVYITSETQVDLIKYLDLRTSVNDAVVKTTPWTFEDYEAICEETPALYDTLLAQLENAVDDK